MRPLDDSPISAQARKVVEGYMRRYGHDWEKVRAELRLDFDLLMQGGSGARLFAHALDDMFHEIRPTGA